MDADAELTHDLVQIVVQNQCYISWIAAGTTGGSLVEPGVGTLVGFLGGLLWASYTCKPIAKSMTGVQRFLKDADLRAYHAELSKITPVSRDDALKLAGLAFHKSKISASNSCAAPPAAGAQIKKLLEQGAAT
jgi:hypothetical protein